MNEAIQLLMDKRETLIAERNTIENDYNQRINEIEDSIEKLSGGKIEFDNLGDTRYNDESPDYIKGTEDGI